jgi:hypothetical protein
VRRFLAGSPPAYLDGDYPPRICSERLTASFISAKSSRLSPKSANKSSRKRDKDIKPISVSELTMPAKVKSKPRFYEVDEINRPIAAASESGASIVNVQKQAPEWNIQGVDPRGFRSSASKQSEVGGTSK